jgi:hypothetical protein
VPIFLKLYLHRAAERTPSRKPTCRILHKWTNQNYDPKAIEHQRLDADRSM